jgi:hypothetical protein
MIPGQTRQIISRNSFSKITKAKWAGSLTQAVEWLCCQHKALISKPSSTKKFKEITNICLKNYSGIFKDKSSILVIVKNRGVLLLS